jgi:hypothetical protein
MPQQLLPRMRITPTLLAPENTNKQSDLAISKTKLLDITTWNIA